MTKTITRADIASAVYEQLGISHAESSDIVDTIIEEIVSTLAKGEEVKLSSFGTFEIRQKKERIGRNPKTKKEIPITARSVVTFHASNLLTKRVNS